MGFFKKTTSSYPARRNRINQQSHPATVIPPSNYGAQNPTPIAASVYQANGTPVAPTVAATTATTVAASTYTAAAFPSNNAPVQATVYIPGQSPAQPVTSVPVTATAYVPGNAQTATTTATHHIATPVQPVSAYNTPSAPPATNPLYSNQAPSFNNGNGNYNSDENQFWECSICK